VDAQRHGDDGRGFAQARDRIKTLFAVLVPVGASAGLIGAVSALVAPHGYGTVQLVLITVACTVVLLVWVRKIAPACHQGQAA